jgi:signal transduction histidine kinase
LPPRARSLPISTARPAIPRTLFGLFAALATRCNTTEELLRGTLDLMGEVFDASRCCILLEDSGVLRMAAWSGMSDEEARTVAITPGSGVAGDVFSRGEARIGEAEPHGQYTSSSYMCAPLRGDKLTYGVCCVTSRGAGEAFSEYDLATLQSLGTMAGMMVERARLHARVNSQREELERLIESMPIGVILLDGRDRVFRYNGTAALLLAPGNVLLMEGRPLALEADSPVSAEIVGLANRARHQTRRLSQEVRVHPTPDSSGLPVRVSCSPVDTNGDVLVMIEDLALSHEVEELRRLDQMKTSFVSLVSHELRTPVTSLRGAARLLQSSYGASVDETGRRLLRIVTENSERLASMVNTIIDITLIDQNQLVVQPTYGRIDEAIRQLLDDRAGALAAKSLSAELTGDMGLAAFRFDPERVPQALAQIIDNAIKFARTGSAIRIELAAAGPRSVAIRVHNEGEPIAPENRQRVFEKFYQTANIMTRAQGGVGLGLYLAKRLIELHGGRIEVLDVPTGATFEVILPRR